jgi:cobalt-zinc-cadmium efflux system outer membrane protein
VLAACAFLAISSGSAARGDSQPEPGATRAPVVPKEVELPTELSLEVALQIFRTAGLDLLLADAAVLSAGGDVQTASAVANPNVAFSAGPTFNYNAHAPPRCLGCEQYVINWSMADNGAVFDSLVHKRGLRIEAALAALAAAQLSRVDAERTLEFQVKQQYMQVGLARMSLRFAREIQASMTQTWELTRLRYPKLIDEGALSRMRIQKLEADQGVATAENALRQAQLGLAFLLGVRGPVPDFAVAEQEFKYRSLPRLRELNERALLEYALQYRPDLRAAVAQKDRAALALRLAKRLRFPDINLEVSYTQIGVGQDAGQPPGLYFGGAVNLPIFYQQQGELLRADAELDTRTLQQAKAVAQVAADIGNSAAGFRAARELVERMEGTLLERAGKARDIVNLQYKAGAATLIDFLDAQRTYIATHQEYFQDLINYFTALYQLEQAVGVELRK